MESGAAIYGLEFQVRLARYGLVRAQGFVFGGLFMHVGECW
jgi:hypothetical protein